MANSKWNQKLGGKIIIMGAANKNIMADAMHLTYVEIFLAATQLGFDLLLLLF